MFYPRRTDDVQLFTTTANTPSIYAGPGMTQQLMTPANGALGNFATNIAQTATVYQQLE